MQDLFFNKLYYPLSFITKQVEDARLVSFFFVILVVVLMVCRFTAKKKLFQYNNLYNIFLKNSALKQTKADLLTADAHCHISSVFRNVVRQHILLFSKTSRMKTKIEWCILFWEDFIFSFAW